MKKRLTSLLLAAAMVLTMTASPVFATGGDSQDSGAAIGTSDGICEHHTYHTDECGYVAAVAEQPCQHTHDETCGYAAAVAETPCDMGCTGADGDGNIIHEEGCAYTPAVEEQLCRHVHDETCGYVAAVEGSPCTYDCTICNGESGGEQTPAGAENTCTCTEKCAEGAGNTDCPVCATDTTLCEGTEQQSAPTCTCTTPCSEGEMNTECPACSAEGANLSSCLGQPAAAADEEVARVQGLIDALPALSEMESMSDDEREAAIVQYTEAYEAYEALTGEQKALVAGAEALEQFAALMQEGVAQTNDTETIIITGTLKRQDLKIEKDTTIDLSQAQSGEFVPINLLPMEEGLNITIIGNADSVLNTEIDIDYVHTDSRINVKSGTLILKDLKMTGGIRHSMAEKGNYTLQYSGNIEIHEINADAWYAVAPEDKAIFTIKALGSATLKSDYGIYTKHNGGYIDYILEGGTLYISGEGIGHANSVTVDIRNCTIYFDKEGIYGYEINIENSKLHNVAYINALSSYFINDEPSSPSDDRFEGTEIRITGSDIDFNYDNFKNTMLGRAETILIDESRIKGEVPKEHCGIGGVYETLTIQNSTINVSAEEGPAIGVHMSELPDYPEGSTIKIIDSTVTAVSEKAAAIGMPYDWQYDDHGYYKSMNIIISGDSTVVDAKSINSAAIGGGRSGSLSTNNDDIELGIGGSVDDWDNGTPTDGTISRARSLLRSTPRNSGQAQQIESNIATKSKLTSNAVITIEDSPTIHAMSGVLAVYGQITCNDTNLVQNTLISPYDYSNDTQYQAESPGSVTIGSDSLGELGKGYASIASTKIDVQTDVNMYFGSSKLYDKANNYSETFSVTATGWQPFFTRAALEIYGTVQVVENNNERNPVNDSVKVGTQLLADIKGLFPASVQGAGGQVSCQWYRDGKEIQGAWYRAYTPGIDDTGHVLYCVITGNPTDGYTGSVQSNAVTVVADESSVPTVSAPTLESRTTDSITLKSAGDSYQYKIINGPTGSEDWQSETVFTGLEKGKTYTFIQKDGDENISTPANFSTKSDAPDPDEFTFDYVLEQLKFPNDVLIFADAACTGTAINQNSSGMRVNISDYISNSNETEQKLYARYAADMEALSVTEITVPKRPAITPPLRNDVLVTLDSISFTGVQGVSYRLYQGSGDSATQVGTQQLGDGSTITFNNLSAGQTYTLKMRVEASNDLADPHFHSDQYDLELSLPQASAMTGTILVPANTAGDRSYDLSLWLGTTAITAVKENADIDNIINDSSAVYSGTTLTITAASVDADKTATLIVNAGTGKILTLTVETVTALAEEKQDGVLWVKPSGSAADYIDGGKTESELNNALDSAAQADGYSAEGKESFILRPLNAVGGDLAASRGDVKISFTPASATDLAGKVIAMYMIPKAGGVPQKIPAERNAEGGVDFTLSGQGGYLCFYYKDGQTAEISIDKITVNDGTADASTAVYQDQVSVQVSVADGTGSTAKTPTGTVTLYNGKPGETGTTELATGVLNNGKAELTFLVDAAKDLTLYAAYSGDGNYTTGNSGEKTLTVSPKPLTDAMIADITGTFTYNGSLHTPTPAVSFTNGAGTTVTLTACSVNSESHTHGTGCSGDFYYNYEDNTNAGTGTVTINAVVNGNYSGSASKTFTISAVKAEGTVTLTHGDSNNNSTLDTSDTLTVDISGVTPAGGTPSYQWKKKTADGQTTDIATGASYTLEDTDRGGEIFCEVTFNGNTTGTLTSNGMTIAKQPLQGSITITPSPAGSTPTVGSQLQVGKPTNSGIDADDYTIAWYRDGNLIPDETGETYQVTRDDLGKTITAVLTATENNPQFTGELTAALAIPAIAPEQPVITAQPGDGSVTISWTKPAENGTPITGYELSVTQNGTPISGSPITIEPTATTYTLSGLSNGRTYEFTLTAINAVGRTASDPVQATPKSQGSSSGSSGSSSYRDREYDFWMEVKEKIQNADPGDTIKANARSYDRMPWSVMEALRQADDVTLHITWNGGEDIIIPSAAALNEQNRIYYPLSYLEDMTFEAEPKAPVADPDKVNPETGGILEVTAPAVTTPAGEPEVTDSRRGLAETPELAEEGIEQPLPGIYEPEETVTTSTTEESGTSGLWIAGVVAVLAAAGGFWFWKRRSNG